MTTINITGGDAVRALALKIRKDYPLEFERVLKTTMRAIGRRTVGELKRASPVGATGNLKKAHDSAVSKDGQELIVFNRLRRSLFTAGGIGPGASPPRAGKFPWDNTRQGVDRNPLRDWVKKKGIASRIRRDVNARRKKKKITLEQATNIGAFLVARAIKRRGLQPNDWFERTIRKEVPRMRRDIRNVLVKFSRRVSGDNT